MEYTSTPLWAEDMVNLFSFYCFICLNYVMHYYIYLSDLCNILINNIFFKFILLRYSICLFYVNDLESLKFRDYLWKLSVCMRLFVNVITSSEYIFVYFLVGL